MNNLKAKYPSCKFEYLIPLSKELVRTIPQNKLYWGVYIRMIAEGMGELIADDLHEDLKLLFNPKDSRLVPGAKVGGSTSKMTRKEFKQYLEKIKIWALQFHGIDLPEPS